MQDGVQADQSGVLQIQEITGLFYMLILFMGAHTFWARARSVPLRRPCLRSVCRTALAFVWSFGEWGAVCFARNYPVAYKRMSDLAERLWFQEQHHKNVTLSRRCQRSPSPQPLLGGMPGRRTRCCARRFSNVELPETLPERSRHSKAAADDALRDLPSLQARHSRLGRTASGREESPRSEPLRLGAGGTACTAHVLPALLRQEAHARGLCAGVGSEPYQLPATALQTPPSAA